VLAESTVGIDTCHAKVTALKNNDSSSAGWEEYDAADVQQAKESRAAEIGQSL
jgi:hypothetical protein